MPRWRFDIEDSLNEEVSRDQRYAASQADQSRAKDPSSRVKLITTGVLSNPLLVWSS